MKITWLGHACFQVESKDYTVVFDPYEDHYVPGYLPIREEANEVFCSHGHKDHAAREVVTLKETKVSPFTVTEISTYHDDEKGALRGENKIHILDDGTYRIAHLGDLGCELEEGQKEQLKGLDAVMIPIGGHYTIDAARAKKLIDEIKPTVILPMHYRSETFGYDVIGTLEDFTVLCDCVTEYETSTIELEEDMMEQVAVLLPKCGGTEKIR